MPNRLLITNVSIAKMDEPDDGYGLMTHAALLIQGDKIEWLGAVSDIPAGLRDSEQLDAGGRLLTPALIDCHTHIVHGGNRAREFEMRLEGASYEEIARAGVVLSQRSLQRVKPMKPHCSKMRLNVQMR
jgi:imidazolonepropionase